MNFDQAADVILKVLALIALVLLNGFFVAAEFALVKVRETQLQPLIHRGHRRARMASHLLSHLDAYLSAAQLGITLASLGLGWIGEPVFRTLLAPVFDLAGLDAVRQAGIRETLAVGIGFTVITFLHIVVGEMAPKTLALSKPLHTAVWVAYPFRWFYLTMKPFIWVLNESSLWLLRRCGVAVGADREGTHTEEELRLLFDATQRLAGGSKLGREIVLNALDLRRRVAREVMRPRREITVLDTAAGISACLELAERTRYSRFPLCEDGNVDRTLGVVHVKDLHALRHRAQTGADLTPAARKLIYVPTTARLEPLLQRFLERKLHMAVVVDEYGGTVGLVTLENILEELVGQIQDEFDHEKPLLVKLGEDSWSVDGALPLHELAELVGEAIVAADVATSGGLLIQRLGGFPKEGDRVKLGVFDLRVEEMDGRRVARLQLTRVVPRTGTGGEPNR